MDDALPIHEIRPLTALRGIAAVWVVGYHLNLWMPLPPLPRLVFDQGYLGVEVFFLLSGYILATVYRTLRPSAWKPFLLRRVFRLYPLHVTIMFFLAFKTAAFFHSDPSAAVYNSWATFVPVLLLLQPVFGIANHWNAPSWSIGVEMICYLLFPFSIGALKSFGRPFSIAAAVGLLLGSLYIAFFTPGDHTEGSVAILRGLCGFYAGCLLRNLIDPSSISDSRLLQALAPKPIHWVGEVSYSIYLLHAPMISACRHLVFVLENYMSELRACQIIALVIVVLTIGLSLLTYTYIEKPGRRLFATLQPKYRRVTNLDHGSSV